MEQQLNMERSRTQMVEEKHNEEIRWMKEDFERDMLHWKKEWEQIYENKLTEKEDINQSYMEDKDNEIRKLEKQHKLKVKELDLEIDHRKKEVSRMEDTLKSQAKV